MSVARHCNAEQMPSAEKSNTVQLFYKRIEYFTKCHITVTRCLQTGWKFTWEWVNESEREALNSIFEIKIAERGSAYQLIATAAAAADAIANSIDPTIIYALKRQTRKRETQRKRPKMRWETVFKIRIEFCAFVYLAEFFLFIQYLCHYIINICLMMLLLLPLLPLPLPLSLLCHQCRDRQHSWKIDRHAFQIQ